MSMNSSAGFKKRSLLRPPSGMLSNQREFLRIIDISQSEPILASNIRSQVASIQEQISLIDKDKRIRTGESSLQKGYALSMKKWLKDCQSSIEKQDDELKVLKQLGVDSYQNGFKKLWKIMLHLDLIATKATQLQVISFLQYDQLFNELAEDSPNASKILQKIAKGGFNPSNFHAPQLILDRSSEIFSTAAKLRRQGSAQNSSKGFAKQTKDDTNILIQQLRGENQKLASLLEQLQQNTRRDKAAQQSTKQAVKKQDSATILYNKNPQSIFSQVQAKYSQKIRQQNTKIAHLNAEIAQLKTEYGSVETRLKVAEQQVSEQQLVTKANRPKAGSYEQALLEQMTKMKNGFEKKIQRIMQEYSAKQREMRKKEYESRTENEKVKWQKGLLLKKFEALSTA